MSELEAGDEVEQGVTIRVHYDGETVEGTVTETRSSGKKAIIEGEDGDDYALFIPQYSFDGFDLQRGNPLAGASREVVTRDADKVEVLD